MTTIKTRDAWHAEHQAYLDLDATSRSDMWLFKQSPELYYLVKTGKLPRREPTKSMLFGTLVDDYICSKWELMPSTDPPPGVKVAPAEVLSKSGSRTGGKFNDWVMDSFEGAVTWTKQWIDEHVWTDKIHRQFAHDVLAQHDILHRIKQQLLGHARADAILSHPRIEFQPAYYFAYEGFELKTKPDFVIPGLCLGDIKTAVSTSAEHFARACADYGYHLQQWMAQYAHHEATGENLPFVFVVIRNDEPYNVECYSLDDAGDEWMTLARNTVDHILARMQECQESGKWHSATHGTVTTIEPPRYLKYRQEYEL